MLDIFIFSKMPIFCPVLRNCQRKVLQSFFLQINIISLGKIILNELPTEYPKIHLIF